MEIVSRIVLLLKEFYSRHLEDLWQLNQFRVPSERMMCRLKRS
jgi:hypothetical protein